MPRKCSHPVDSDRCYMCEQEDKEQEAQDDKLCEAIGRLIARGKLRVVTRVVSTTLAPFDKLECDLETR